MSIDALTVIEGESVVYSGLVREYWFDDKSGALDTMWIDAAERQSVHLQGEGASDTAASMIAPRSRSVQSPGSRFALRMQEIRNVNLLYVSRVPGARAGGSSCSVSAGHIDREQPWHVVCSPAGVNNVHRASARRCHAAGNRPKHGTPCAGRPRNLRRLWRAQAALMAAECG